MYVRDANYQVAPQTDLNELELQVHRNINNLKRVIHHDQVNRRILPGRESVSKRNLLEAPSQQHTLDFGTNDFDVDHDLVSVIRLPKKL